MENMDFESVSGHEKEDVRNRLLDAAEKLFCSKGFHATSVRELTAEANCNLAAVNYHFGGKDQLYVEMFRREFEMMIERNLESINTIMNGPEPTAEKLIRAILEPSIRQISEHEPKGQVMRMLVREVMNKKVDPEFVAKDIKVRLFDRIGRAFKQLVPTLPDDEMILTLVVSSFDGVLLHPFLFMELYHKTMPGLTIDVLIDHMVKFVAAAIRGYAK